METPDTDQEVEVTDVDTPEAETQDDYVETPDELETSQDDPAPASDSGNDTEPADEPEPPRRNRAQERIDELTADKYRLKGQLDALQQQLATKQEPAKPPPPELVAPTEPKLDDFEDMESFMAAQRNWTRETIDYNRKVDARDRNVEATNNAKAAAEEARRAEAGATWQSQVADAKTRHSDFDVVAFDPNLPVSASMGDAIQAADNGADVLYFLGKNPDRSARIAQMEPYQAAMEIGKISGQVTATKAPPATRKVSQAPKPAQPDRTTATPEKDPSKMNQAEYKAWREGGGGRRERGRRGRYVLCSCAVRLTFACCVLNRKNAA